jgi:hypothetical protein
MVHMEGGVPAAVRAIVPETDEERELYRQGEEKYREIRAKYKQRT